MSLFTKAVKLSTRAIKKGGSNKSRTKSGKKTLAEERAAKKALSADKAVAKNRQDAGGVAAGRARAIVSSEKRLGMLEKKVKSLTGKPKKDMKEEIERLKIGISNKKGAQQGKRDQFGLGGLKDIEVKGTAGSLPKDKATLVHQGKVRKAGDKVGVKFLKKQPVKVDPKAPKETLPPMKKQLTLKSLNKLREKKGLPPLKKLPNIGGRVKKIKRAKGGTVKPKKSVYKTGGTIKRKSGGKISPQRGWGKARSL